MQPPEILAVCFDLDGLMLNTEDVFAMAGVKLLQRRNMQMTREIHMAMLGRRPLEAFEAMIALTGITDPIPDLMDETRILFDDISRDHLAIMEGLPDLLDAIERSDLPKAVATSSPRDYLNSMLARFDLTARFSHLLAAEDVSEGKPEPEIYLRAAELLQVKPSQMLVLEDSQAGTTAASRAGAFVVSVPNEHTRDGDFSMANYVAESLADDFIKKCVSTSRSQTL